MTRIHCDWCDKVIEEDENEARHYKRKGYKLHVTHDEREFQVCRQCIGEIRQCIGEIFFNLKPVKD